MSPGTLSFLMCSTVTRDRSTIVVVAKKNLCLCVVFCQRVHSSDELGILSKPEAIFLCYEETLCHVSEPKCNSRIHKSRSIFFNCWGSASWHFLQQGWHLTQQGVDSRLHEDLSEWWVTMSISVVSKSCSSLYPVGDPGFPSGWAPTPREGDDKNCMKIKMDWEGVRPSIRHWSHWVQLHWHLVCVSFWAVSNLMGVHTGKYGIPFKSQWCCFQWLQDVHLTRKNFKNDSRFPVPLETR